MIEDWEILRSFFPLGWEEMALQTGALKGLRKNKSAEDFLRTLLLHVGCGYSLRETVARAKLANLADMSDVALLGRLKKAKDWLHAMCLALLKEQVDSPSHNEGFKVRLFDATNVKEPGQTGSLWRIHYSVVFPSLLCDFLKPTACKGQGTGETFFQFSIRKGDFIIADRGYSTAPGIHHVASKKAHVMVRVNTQSLPILCVKAARFPLLQKVTSIKKAGTIASWNVIIPGNDNRTVPGRICAVRKTKEAIQLAHDRLRKTATRKGHVLRPETFEYAKYVIIFTTFPEKSFSAPEILNWYRCRWQVELIFKRFKSIAALGHLPKHDQESSKAWLYGKLFVALLTSRLINYASAISPWGYNLEESTPAERLARIQLRV